jgi:hypothetical protein
MTTSTKRDHKELAGSLPGPAGRFRRRYKSAAQSDSDRAGAGGPERKTKQLVM